MANITGCQGTVALRVVGGGSRPNRLERMAQIVRQNERLFGELRDLGDRIVRARAYLAEPGCNRVLAVANINLLRNKHSTVLVHLRANRIEARQMLAESAGRAS